MIDFADEVRKLRRDIGFFTSSDACLVQAQGTADLCLFICRKECSGFFAKC